MAIDATKNILNGAIAVLELQLKHWSCQRLIIAENPDFLVAEFLETADLSIYNLSR